MADDYVQGYNYNYGNEYYDGVYENDEGNGDGYNAEQYYYAPENTVNYVNSHIESIVKEFIRQWFTLIVADPDCLAFLYDVGASLEYQRIPFIIQPPEHKICKGPMKIQEQLRYLRHNRGRFEVRQIFYTSEVKPLYEQVGDHTFVHSGGYTQDEQEISIIASGSYSSIIGGRYLIGLFDEELFSIRKQTFSMAYVNKWIEAPELEESLEAMQRQMAEYQNQMADNDDTSGPSTEPALNMQPNVAINAFSISSPSIYQHDETQYLEAPLPRDDYLPAPRTGRPEFAVPCSIPDY